MSKITSFNDFIYNENSNLPSARACIYYQPFNDEPHFKFQFAWKDLSGQTCGAAGDIDGHEAVHWMRSHKENECCTMFDKTEIKTLIQLLSMVYVHMED